MKALRLFLVLVIAFMAIGLLPSSVKAQQFSGYMTGINVQNLDSGVGTVTLTFYNSGNANGTGGASVNSVTDDIAGYGVKSYFPLTAVPAGFSGSVVVSSSTKVAAVTNVSNTTLSSLGAYNGSSQGSTTVYLPLLHKGNSGWNSWYSIQNTATTAATVHIDYTSTTATDDASVIVAPGASVTIYQKNETMHGTFRSFAATLTSDQPIAVVVIQENVNNIMAYTGFPAGSLTPIMPTINMNNSGYITGTQIYNLGTSSTDVTVSYTAGQSGTDCTETQTIPGKTMKVFTSGAFSGTVTGEDCVAGQRFIGSAKVTSNTGDQQLAVVVNQLKTNGTNGSAYGAFDPSAAKSTVFMPTIFDRNSNWNTAFNVMNVGSSTAYIKCTYANSTISSIVKVRDTLGNLVDGLPAGAVSTVSQYNLIGLKYVGSSVCKTYTDATYTTEDTTNGKILAVVNELGPGLQDNLLTYEGINP